MNKFKTENKLEIELENLIYDYSIFKEETIEANNELRREIEKLKKENNQLKGDDSK